MRKGQPDKSERKEKENDGWTGGGQAAMTPF